MTDTTIKLRLGFEELVSLMAALGLRGLPGIGENVWEGLDESQVSLVMSAGLNALRARGWVADEAMSDGKPRLAIDSTVLAVVGTCARASWLVYLNRLPMDAPPEMAYLHLGPQLLVLHHTPHSGVHEFIGSVDKTEMLKEIEAILQLDGQPNRSERLAVTISQVGFDKAVTLARNNQRAEAINILIQAGNSPEAVAQLIDSIYTVRSNSLITQVRLQASDSSTAVEPVTSFSLLNEPSRLWMIQDKGNEQVTLTLTSLQHCREVVGHLIEFHAF